jgi:hypothetical protein
MFISILEKCLLGLQRLGRIIKISKGDQLKQLNERKTRIRKLLEGCVEVHGSFLPNSTTSGNPSPAA